VQRCHCMGIQASVCSYCNQDKEINKKKRCILHTGVVLQIWSWQMLFFSFFLISQAKKRCHLRVGIRCQECQNAGFGSIYSRASRSPAAKCSRPHFFTTYFLIFSTYFNFYWKPCKNCLWWPCLLTDRDEMSNLHRCHSIDASCHVLVNLA
jgi:hypothetical protein